MSSGAAAARGARRRHRNIGGDVTLNDFANAPVRKSRPRKSDVVREFEKLQIEDSGKGWDEKSEEFEGTFVREESEDGSVKYVIAKPQKPKKTKKTSESCDHQTAFENVLPIDVWFLIGKFVLPEDVGRFALICRASYTVVCSSKFWIDLYRRYYVPEIKLPEDLKPDHLKRKFGIRTLTVRSLFLTYRPFIDRIRRTLLTRSHPKDHLIKRKCSLMWQQKKGKTWSFFFKLKENGISTADRYEHLDLIDKLDDVFVNPDENCKMLIINSLRFIAIPPVQNFTLCDLNISLSTDLLQNRWKLRFSSGAIYRSKQLSDFVEVTIGNVISFKVLDWWHPEYPRTSTLEIFLNGD